MAITKTETKDHEIRRDDYADETFDRAGIGGLYEHCHRTTVEDKETGAIGDGRGKTKEEADDAAYDSLRSANEARHR